MLALKDQAKSVEKGIPQALALQYAPFGEVAELRSQLLTAAFDRAFLVEPWPRTRAEFEKRREEGRNRVTLIAQEMGRLVGAILTEFFALQRKIATLAKPFPEVARDLTEWQGRLLQKGFLAQTPFERLQHFPRYLKAAAVRIDKLRADPARDAQRLAELRPLEQRHQRRLAELKGQADARLEDFRWQLEELRISLFAQELRTPQPVSAKRLEKAWQQLAG